jgi:spore germination cell wall hydrolase CwlJ-like protein|tara:strand:- start:7373 stop:7789 length:417 start_codon:yes stop_codon:yes gene_type:complete
MIAEALMCLALNVYFEARSENMASQVAVSLVVMNRVEDHRFPNTVCGVVKQGLTYKNDKVVLGKCQFSWYCDGKSDKPTNKKAWFQAKEIASIVLDGGVFDFTEGATHYHAYYVYPSWRKTKTKVARIDSHIFYRWEQ